MFVCGIGGCARSYGSASSLCAHKRRTTQGWKEDRKRQLEAQVQTDAIFDGDNRNAVGEDEGAEQAEGEDKEEEDDEDEEGGDAAGRSSPRAPRPLMPSHAVPIRRVGGVTCSRHAWTARCA